MTGVNLKTAKVYMFDRSPFIDMVMMKGDSKENVDKYFDELEQVVTEYSTFHLVNDSFKSLFNSKNLHVSRLIQKA